MKREFHGLRRSKGYCRDWYDEFRPLLQSDNIPIRPERVCHDLSLNLPDNSFVVVDTGHGGMWMGGMFDLKSSGQSYIRSAGHLGWAFPASLGVKCAAPDRPVICFTGDAGFWYHIAEVETAVRWGINAVIVVNNNGAGNQSKGDLIGSMAVLKQTRQERCGRLIMLTLLKLPSIWALSQ